MNARSGTLIEVGPGAVGAAPVRGQHLIGGAVMAKPTCSVPDCEREVRCKGVCSKHYHRLLTAGYSDGCRCAECRAAHTEDASHRRKKVKR